MARGRFLSDSVAKDMKLNSLSVEAELVYLLCIPHLDRDGLIEGDTDILFGTVCPKRRQFIDRMGEFVQEWVSVGLVTCYDSDNGPVLWFRGFAKNQLGLRYDRETPSKFPPLPNLTPVDSMPPSGILPEASDNCSLAHAADARPEFELEVQLELEEGDRVHADARVTEPPTPPPSYRTEPLPGEYIPGVRRPQQNQAKRNCDHFTAQATSHGVGPEPFRLMVDAVLNATGKTALANTNGDLGQQTLNQAKETVVTLLEMGRQALEDVRAVLDSWRENDWRGTSPPTFSQIVEHASAMDAGTHITTRRQDSGKKEFASLGDYNEWARRNDPQCKRIKEGVLIKGILIKRATYQLPAVH